MPPPPPGAKAIFVNHRRSWLYSPFCLIPQHRESQTGKQWSETDNAAITDFVFCYSTNQSFKQSNYKPHKKDLAPAPSSFYQFLYNLKIKVLQIDLMGDGFPAFFFFFFFFCLWLLLLLKKDVKGLIDVFPLEGGGLENLECRKSHLPHF